MSEPFETTLYPIVRDILMDNIDEDKVSDKEITILTNMICNAFNKKYKIEKK